MERPENRSYGKERIDIKMRCWSNWNPFLLHFSGLSFPQIFLSRHIKGNEDGECYYGHIRQGIEYDGILYARE